jgi:hypothetical protein
MVLRVIVWVDFMFPTRPRLDLIAEPVLTFSRKMGATVVVHRFANEHSGEQGKRGDFRLLKHS